MRPGQSEAISSVGDSIPSALDEVRAAIAARLRLPDNLGVELRPLRLPAWHAAAGLIAFIQGDADEELVRMRVLEQLAASGQSAPSLEALAHMLPAFRTELTDSLDAAVRAILGGATALYVDGQPQLLLMQTRPAGDKTKESMKVFGFRLAENVAILRTRMQNPALVARPLGLPAARTDGAALIYVEGRPEAQVVEQVRTWVRQHGSEESLRRGLGAGMTGRLGLIPHLTSTAWPAKVAALLDAGHVAIMVEGLALAYLAPVTAPALLYSPGDEALLRPVAVSARALRVVLGALVVLSPAAVVALSEYHQEMIPTAFLLGLAAVRESAGLPMAGEVIVLELLQDLMRTAATRLPSSAAAGAALLASILFILVMVLTGLIQPLTSFASIVVAAAALALPDYDMRYIARAWRWPMIAGASIFGLFGMSSVTLLLLIYIVQANSFGVPFLGEPGLQFSTPLAAAANPKARGGRKHGERPAVW
jgi:hypothetical protein